MIGENLARVREQIAEAARACGRDPAEIELIAVSKRHPADRIRTAVAVGQRHFGESTGQELRDKAAEIDGVLWHYIGRLQTNKAKYIAPHAHRVHALESVHQAEALAQRAPGPLHCLVAVNVGREPQKSGVLPEDTLERLGALSRVEGIVLTGLMCLPPYREDPEQVAPFYEELADLCKRARGAGFALNELSMGMSHDFEVAIRYGATWVRVGTAIFGPRP